MYICQTQNVNQLLIGLLKGYTPKIKTFINDDESKNNSVNAKKSKIFSTKLWPRLRVIGSSEEGPLRKLSSFAIQKGLKGFAGDLKRVKKLKNASLLIKCTTEIYSSNLLTSKLLCNVTIKVPPHSSLDSSKGVIGLGGLKGVNDEEICENLVSQG